MTSHHWTPKDDHAWRNIETPDLSWYLNFQDLSGWQRRQEIEAKANRARLFKLARQPMLGNKRLWGVIDTLKRTLAFLRLPLRPDTRSSTTH